MSVELLDCVLEELRILVVAGVAYGLVVVGAGSRLAMLLLRVTSPGSVVGRQSDDDFTIGEFTISGTLNLLMLGAAVGVIGAGAYRLVRRWLIGPVWFRHLTTGLAAGAVAGSMLLHADGIDFRVLKPTWLAVGLFIALPFVFGTFIGPVVDAVARRDSWTRQGRRRWALPTASLIAAPPTIAIALFVATPVTVLLVLGRAEAVQRVRTTTPYGLAIRSVWLGIALLGLVAVIGDITDIARVV